MNFESLSDLPLKNRSESYWKGEDFFIFAEFEDYGEDLLDFYTDFGSSDRNLRLGDLSFLKRDSEYIYDFIRTLKKIRVELGEYFFELVRSVIRTKFFDLDYVSKVDDDIYFSIELNKFLECMFIEVKSIFGIDFDFVEEDIKKFPIRSTSETLNYLFCLNLLFKRISQVRANPVSTVIKPVIDGTYVITFVKTEFNKPITETELRVVRKDELDQILNKNFNIEDDGFNSGQMVHGESLVYWFSWTL